MLLSEKISTTSSLFVLYKTVTNVPSFDDLQKIDMGYIRNKNYAPHRSEHFSMECSICSCEKYNSVKRIWLDKACDRLLTIRMLIEKATEFNLILNTWESQYPVYTVQNKSLNSFKGCNMNLVEWRPHYGGIR